MRIYQMGTADLALTPFNVRTSKERGQCSCKSYNFQLWFMKFLNTQADVRFFLISLAYFQQVLDASWFY